MRDMEFVGMQLDCVLAGYAHDGDGATEMAFLPFHRNAQVIIARLELPVKTGIVHIPQ